MSGNSIVGQLIKCDMTIQWNIIINKKAWAMHLWHKSQNCCWVREKPDDNDKIIHINISHNWEKYKLIFRQESPSGFPGSAQTPTGGSRASGRISLGLVFTVLSPLVLSWACVYTKLYLSNCIFTSMQWTHLNKTIKLLSGMRFLCCPCPGLWDYTNY